jgi:hypothetical protein
MWRVSRKYRGLETLREMVLNKEGRAEGATGNKKLGNAFINKKIQNFETSL